MYIRLAVSAIAFVEMDDGAADAALSKLNGADIGGRKLRVDEARPK